MPALSVTVITRNEAANIAAALESVAWADEIVVVDAESTDATVALARERASSVHIRKWEGFVSQKNFAADAARHDWILSLDADERVSPELAEEIRRVLCATPPYAGFYVPRVSFYLGRWIRSTDWYPDTQLRLYDRRAARWAGGRVHESVRTEGPVGRLRSDLLHYPYRDIAHHWETINRYTTLAALEMHEAGRHASIAGVAFRPPLAFVRNYVLKLGFTDGGPGLVVSLLNSAYVLLKFAKLWELGRAGRR
ncbi:MAG: glycosyltransferase family 2 protein [Vicinamibacterales bacterium]